MPTIVLGSVNARRRRPARAGIPGRRADASENDRAALHAAARTAENGPARAVVFTQSSALYARGVGRGDDPNALGSNFYVFYTRRINRNNADVRRFEVSCR